MSRADDHAFPIPCVPGLPNGNVDYGAPGLTIREHTAIEMAKAILTGAVMRGCPATEWTDMDMATKCADALIAELAKPAKPDPLLVEASEIVENFVGLVKTVPELNHQKYNSFGARVRKFQSDAAARVKA